MIKTVRTVWLFTAVRPSDVPSVDAGSMPYNFATSSVGSPIIGKFGACPCDSRMSFDHRAWLSTGSTLKPMILYSLPRPAHRRGKNAGLGNEHKGARDRGFLAALTSFVPAGGAGRGLSAS